MQKVRCSILLTVQLLIDLLIQIFSLGFLSFFSTFPHGTNTLSLNLSYLALEDGTPLFKQVFSHSTFIHFKD